MKFTLVIVSIILNVTKLNAFIIPDELPSILSVIYSNIPTLKKGTDSRIGWGFRLGDRADFQVLVELGPQTYTQPLANQGEQGANKRNTLNNLANSLYAQRQQEKKEKLQKEKDIQKSPGGQWLQNWSKTITKSEDQENQTVPLKAKPGIAIGEIDAKSVIPDDSVLEEIEKRKLKSEVKPIKPPIKNDKKTATITTPQSLISILTAEDENKVLNDKGVERALDDVTLE